MSATTKNITLSYTIIPPADLSAADVKLGNIPVPATAEHTLPIPAINSSSRSPTSTYYESASLALRNAQRFVNEHLTPWKDAIGDREKSKEDLGKVGYGKGRAARMSASIDEPKSSAVSHVGVQGAGADEDTDDDDDEPNEDV